MPPAHDQATTRALVQLVEAQSEQLDTLKRLVSEMEGRLKVRTEIDVLLAHEIRTPLTIIRGVLHTLRERPLAEADRAHFVERALAHAVHLSDVAEDLMQPMPATGFRLPRARMRVTRLRDLVAQAVEAVSHDLDPARVDIDVDHDLSVATSPSRLVAIFVNLLENAAKYAGDGPVEVRAWIGIDRMLVFEVADHGPGFNGADPEQLFSPFTRGPVATAAPGQGVGLFLVRMLVRSLGGEIALDDRPDGGAVAIVKLPQRRTGDPEPSAPDRLGHEEAAALVALQ